MQQFCLFTFCLCFSHSSFLFSFMLNNRPIQTKNWDFSTAIQKENVKRHLRCFHRCHRLPSSHSPLFLTYMYGFWGDNCKIMQQAKQRRQNKAKAYRSLRPQTFSIDCFAIKLPSAESFSWDPLNSWHPSSFVESVVVAIAVTLSWTHEEQQIQCVFYDADVVVVSCGVRMNTVMLRSYHYNEGT